MSLTFKSPDYLDRSVLNQMYDEFVQVQGKWLESSMLLKIRSSKTHRKLGEEHYIPYRDLKKQHGVATAKQMRHQKVELQKKLKPHETPFVMDHPDMPGDPES